MKQLLKFFSSHLYILIPAILFGSCSNPQPPADEQTEADEMVTNEPTQEELIALGEYNVTTMGCHECHSPKIMTPEGPVPDPARLLSGHPADEEFGEYDPAMIQPGKYYLMTQGLTAFAGPWGISYAGNLTSDDTGIGNWTEENFRIAITEGWFKGIRDSRKLLPPMPWPNFVNMTDEDIHAIFVYLQSTTPISNVVPAPGAPAGG
jgi:hypothetical protein